MSDLIKQAVQNFQEKLTEYFLPNINPYPLDYQDNNKKVLLNRTNKSKSQHALQKVIATQSNQSQSTIKKQPSGQSFGKKEISQFSQHSQVDQITDAAEDTNDIININELINEKKKEILSKNKYYLKEISKIRQSFEMKAKIRNKFKNERKSSHSSQELYEKCWDATLQEINSEIAQNQLVGITIDSKEVLAKKKHTYSQKRPKPLRSQLFHKMQEQENKYFKQKSDTLLKLMKQASISIVDEVTAQIEQASLIEKEKQMQRSKEREEGKMDLIKSFRFKEQEKLVKLLQNKSSNRYRQLSKKNLEVCKELPNQGSNDVTISFSKTKKIRSSSFNCVLPIIEQQTDKELISMKNLEKNQTKEKFNEMTQFNRRNLLAKSVKSSQQGQLNLSTMIKYS